MGKDLFFIALGGKGTKRLRAFFVSAVLFAAWTGHSVKHARWFLSLHAFFTRGGPVQLPLALWGISLG